jgi:hypothetical protein
MRHMANHENRRQPHLCGNSSFSGRNMPRHRMSEHAAHPAIAVQHGLHQPPLHGFLGDRQP